MQPLKVPLNLNRIWLGRLRSQIPCLGFRYCPMRIVLGKLVPVVIAVRRKCISFINSALAHAGLAGPPGCGPRDPSTR